MRILQVLGLAAALAFGGIVPAQAADPAPAEKKPDSELPPFPAPASVKQTTRLGGKVLNYTATVGSLPVRDAKGRKIGEVVYTAYVLDGPRNPNRPVTFAFNGGPGAASVYLNLGAIGPKRVQFGAQGDAPSDFAVLQDNPFTWMDFTDMVFIDPVGTGFSRSLTTPEESKKAFFGVKQDIEYLSRVVYDWLLKNERMTSPKYITGESYGGFRGPRLTHYLQTELGVGVNGVILISPFFDGTSWAGADFSPIPFAMTLPSMAAANYERQGKVLNDAQLAEVEAYVRGEYLTDFMRGRGDPAALDRMVARVSAYTGLSPQVVRQMGGRVDSRAFLRELYRADGRIGSWYDFKRHRLRPLPVLAKPAQRRPDPRRPDRPDDQRHRRLHHPRGRLEGGSPLRGLEQRRQRGLGRPAADHRVGLRPAPGAGQRSEDEGADRPRLQRPELPLLRVEDGGRPAAADGQSGPGAAARLSRRPHVLQPPRQRRGHAAGRHGDVRSGLRPRPQIPANSRRPPSMSGRRAFRSAWETAKQPNERPSLPCDAT